MHNFNSEYDGENALESLAAAASAVSGLSRRDARKTATVESDEEIFHIQADGFWGPEKGFHNAEELRRQSQRQN